MDRSSSLTLPNKNKRSSSLLNATPPQRKQPMRSCRRRAPECSLSLLRGFLHLLLVCEIGSTNSSFGCRRQVISGVIPTSACLDESIESKILSLPKELMFNILVLLPADVLYDIMRYLCFRWYKIICDPVFIKAHLRRWSAAAGLFIQYQHYSFDSYYVDMGMTDCKVMRINFQISCRVWASCDGLVLVSNRGVNSILHIVNPITKQLVTLPPFKWSPNVYFTLARARSTGEYKVVATYRVNNVFYCGILNVGKDLTWRKVDTRNISRDMRRIFRCPPYSTGGYVYWAVQILSSFLTLDVEAEVLLEFAAPKYDMPRCEIWYKEMGNFLCCMFWSFKEPLVFEVLVLADPETGEWKNHYKFDLNGKREMISLSLFMEASPQTHVELRPVVWVNNSEVLVFTRLDRFCTRYIAHNVRTGETYSFGMCEENLAVFWCSHVNSLASLDLPQ